MAVFGSNAENHLSHFKKLHKNIEFGGGGDGNEIIEKKAGWRRGKYGDEWCFSEEMPDIRSACVKNNGKVTMGGFNITLDKSGKFLRRRFAQI